MTRVQLMTRAVWANWKPVALEWFVLFNLAFLALDTYVAHVANDFAKFAEWTPVAFSIFSTALLGYAVVRDGGRPEGPLLKPVGQIFGYASIAVGIGGVAFHMEGPLFAEFTLKSLVYTAPLAAPLSYAGLGFLLLLNRSFASESENWQRWLLFFVFGGFAGCFGLSLADHAQNGFFFWTEWIPVAASAFASAFLLVGVFDITRSFLRLCAGILALQAVVGVLGFVLHVNADLHGISQRLYENFVHGAPIFAPLLFTDLFLLGLIGVAEAWMPAEALPDQAG